MKRRQLGGALGALALAATGRAGPARAQDGWPARAVVMVVPWAPGGSNDVVARLLTPGLSEAFGGKSFVVENRAGAGGAVGMAAVARARPDGYQLLVSSASNHVFNHFVVPDQGYDPREALAGIAMLVDVPNCLAVNVDTGVSTVPELIAKIRATRGGMSFASSGVGSSNHLAGELFRLRANVELTHIPYRGGGPAIADLIAGTVPIGFMNLPTAIPAVETGRVRIIGVGAANRVESRPDIPTIAEQGVPDYAVRSWTGLFAPKATPRPIVEKLAAECERLLKLPSTRARLAEIASESIFMGPDETDAYVRAEFDRWGPVVKQAGVSNT